MPVSSRELQQLLGNLQVNIFYLGYTASDYPAGCVLAVGKVACFLVSSIVYSMLVSVLTNYPTGRVLAVGKVACLLVSVQCRWTTLWVACSQGKGCVLVHQPCF